MRINPGFPYFFVKPLVFWTALCLKTALFAFFSWQLWFGQHSFFWEFDDTRSYLTPIEHLLEGKGYSREGVAAYGEPPLVPFAGRLPGMLPVYGPLYVLLGAPAARLVLVLVQFCLSTLAGGVLAWLVWRLWKRRSLASGVFLVYLASYHLHIFDHGGATESLSISASIFSLGAWLKYRFKKEMPPPGTFLPNPPIPQSPNPPIPSAWLWIAGIFFAWAVLLRPVFGSFAFVWIPLLWEKDGIRENVLRLLRFFIPLALVLFFWNLRNYLTLGRIVVLEDRWSYSYPHEPEYGPDGMAIRKLIKAWGGDILYWTEGSMGNALLSPAPSRTIEQTIPRRAYCAAYNADSLQLLREGYFLANDLHQPDSIRNYWERETESRARRYLHAYQQARPVEAFVLSRCRLFVKLFLLPHPPDFPFPPAAQLNLLQLLLKGFYTFFPYLLSLIGWLALLRAIAREKGIRRTLTGFPFVMALVLTAVLGMIESRYALPLWPFFLIYGAGLLKPFTAPDE